MRIAAKNLLLTGSGGWRRFNAEENRNILEAVQAIGDEKRYDHNIGLRGVFAPVCDKRGFLHVGLGNFRINSFFPDGPGLRPGGLGRLLIETGAMSND